MWFKVDCHRPALPLLLSRQWRETMSISSISNQNSALYSYAQNKMAAAKQQQGAESFFSKVDTSQDGTVDKSELLALVDDIASKTGQEVDGESLFTEYDADGDGSFSDEELQSLMQSEDLKPKGAPMGPPPAKEDEDESSEYGSSASIISLLTSIQNSLDSLFSADDTDSSSDSYFGSSDSGTTDYLSMLQSLQSDDSDETTETAYQSTIDKLLQGFYSQNSYEA